MAGGRGSHGISDWKGLNPLSPNPVAFKVGDHRTLGLQEGVSGILPIMKTVLTK